MRAGFFNNVNSCSIRRLTKLGVQIFRFDSNKSKDLDSVNKKANKFVGLFVFTAAPIPMRDESVAA